MCWGVGVDLWGILKSVFWIAFGKIGQRPSSQISNKSARGPNSIFQFSAKCPNLFSKNRPEGRITFFQKSFRGRCFPKFCQRAESHFSENRSDARITFFQNSARGPNLFFVFKKSARGPNNLFPKIGQRVESHFFKSRPEALLTLLLFS